MYPMLLTWNLHQQMLEYPKYIEHNFPNDHKYDCTIQSLYFVNQIDEKNAVELMKIKNAQQKGTTLSEELDLLYYTNSFNELKIKDTIQIIHITSLSDMENPLRETIQEGQCTILHVHDNKEAEGHSFICGVYNGIVMVIDIQLKFIGSFQYYLQYVNEQNICVVKNAIMIAVILRSYTKKRTLSK